MQIGAGGRIGGNIVVFIPNTVGREELLKRPTTESTRMGVHVDLHGMLPSLLRLQRAADDAPPWGVRCRLPLRLGALQVALEEGRCDLEGLGAVVAVLPWVRMQALVVGAKTVEQIQLSLALKTLIVPLHHE